MCNVIKLNTSKNALIKATRDFYKVDIKEAKRIANMYLSLVKGIYNEGI